MKDPEYCVPSHSIKELDETFNPSKNNRNDFVPDLTPMEQDHEQSQPYQGTCEQIPPRRFEIEGEVFMIAPHDDEEPKNINEALFGPKAKERIKAMEEEIESMNTNQVWDLVDLPSG